MTARTAHRQVESLEFVDAGRTFTCSAAPRHATDAHVWWWFRVSSDRQNRYAPFLATADDTAASVQERVVAYYDTMLARRAAPSVPHWRRERPVSPPPAADGAPSPT